MFTGLVEETAQVTSLEPVATGARLKVKASVVTDAGIGDSIAVNGCCLTVTSIEEGIISFDLLSETLARTNLGALKPGSLVNLERALAANARLGGHFVQGHIDGTSDVIGFEKSGQDHRLEIALPGERAQYVVFKGSIAVNGISLTVAEVRDASFVIWIIPHTMEATNLQQVKAGDKVNLEYDLLAKYMERLLEVKKA